MGDHPYVPPGTYEVRECLLAPVSKNSTQRENAKLSQELDALHAKNGDLNLDVSNLQEQLQQVRTQLEDQATKAGEWYSRVGKLEEENEQLRSQSEDQGRRAKEAETLAEERRLEIEQIRQHRDELRSMLDDQATKVERWYTKAKDLEQQIEQSQSVAAVDPEAITLLQAALLLKANAGGAIKDRIREALTLLVNVDSQ